jgi:hypothetical protein
VNPIHFQCPQCHAELDADQPGEELPCPSCSAVLKVPDRSLPSQPRGAYVYAPTYRLRAPDPQQQVLDELRLHGEALTEIRRGVRFFVRLTTISIICALLSLVAAMIMGALASR